MNPFANPIETAIYLKNGDGAVVSAGDHIVLNPTDNGYRGNGVVLSATTTPAFIRDFILSAPRNCVVTVEGWCDFYVSDLDRCVRHK